MRTDVTFGVAHLGCVQINQCSSIFEGSIDFTCSDVVGVVGLSIVSVDGSLKIATIAQNGVDPSGDGSDRTVPCASALLSNDRSFDTILLVGDGDGSFGSL